MARLSGTTRANPGLLGSVAADIEALTATAVHKGDLVVSLADHGGIVNSSGSGATNDAAWTAAMAAIPSRGGGLYIPPGDWYFSTQRTIVKPVHVYGQMGGDLEKGATRLIWPHGVAGIKTELVAGGAGRIRIEDLMLYGSSTAAVSGIYGLHAIRGICEFNRVDIEAFGDHGLFFDSTGGGNVDLSIASGIRSYGNRGDGIRMEGIDCNVITLINPNVTANYGWGLVNLSRNNYIINPHADQQYNGSPGAYRDGGTGCDWVHVYAEGSTPANKFRLETTATSGRLSYDTFGAITLEDAGTSAAMWRIQKNHLNNNLRLKGTNASDHEYWLTPQTAFGALDLLDVTLGTFVFTSHVDGANFYWYRHQNPATTATHDLGNATFKWRNLALSGNAVVDGALDHNGSTAGFYGVTPATRPTAYTQTYSTADKTHAARTAVALTDNAAGTPGTTIGAIANPTDTPATADALRDDLVAVLIPALRTNLSSLAVEHNKVIVDLADTAAALNALIDDLQTLGLLQ